MSYSRTKALVCAVFLLTFCTHAVGDPDGKPFGRRGRLAANFANPPKRARPSAYYLLLNGYCNAEYVGRELRQLSEKGVRGLCVFDMGARGPRRLFRPPVPPS